jgi:hypothetical protein
MTLTALFTLPDDTLEVFYPPVFPSVSSIPAIRDDTVHSSEGVYGGRAVLSDQKKALIMSSCESNFSRSGIVPFVRAMKRQPATLSKGEV